jgi:hypothetical protein
MSITAQDIIQTSLEQIGSYSPGEQVSAADMFRGLSQLNSMIDSWNLEYLICYAIYEQNVTLTVNKGSYTIGTGGDINQTRPLDILIKDGSSYILDNLGNTYPVTVVNQDYWNLIGNKQSPTSQIPDTLFYDPQYPLGVINVWPVPSAAYKLYWDSRLQISSFDSLTTQLSLPPGYQKALQDNLSIELWPFFYSGKQIDPLLLRSAMESKGNIKRTNIKISPSRYDPYIVARGSSSWNIYRDSKW